MGKSSINGPFCMAMLNNQRVYSPMFSRIPSVPLSKTVPPKLPAGRRTARAVGRHAGDLGGSFQPTWAMQLRKKMVQKNRKAEKQNSREAGKYRTRNPKMIPKPAKK